MNNFKEQLKKEASRVTLSPQEKSAMRGVLLRAMGERAVPSPYSGWFSSTPHAALASLLIVVLAGGGTAYAAQGSLPGDALYGIKVNITEPLQGVVQLSTKSKASWNADVALRRVEEAETLASQGKLTTANATELQNNFDEHAATAAALAAHVVTEDPAQDGALSAQIAAGLSAHSAVLAAIADTNGSTTNARTAALMAVHVSSRVRTLLAFEDGDAEVNVMSATTTPLATSSPVALTQSSLRIRHQTLSSQLHVGSVLATNASSSVEVSTSSPSPTVQASTTTPRPHVTSEPVRVAALSAIESLKRQLAGASGLSDNERSTVASGITQAQMLIQHGDSGGTDTNSQAYAQALSMAVSLTTYLSADTEFPSAHLLPVLLGNHADDRAGDK